MPHANFLKSELNCSGVIFVICLVFMEKHSNIFPDQIFFSSFCKLTLPLLILGEQDCVVSSLLGVFESYYKSLYLREGDMMIRKKLLPKLTCWVWLVCSLCYQKCYQISWLPQTLYSLYTRDIHAVIKRFVCDLHNVFVSTTVEIIF